MSRDISNNVFTRNRPLQLEAYLESLYRHMPRAKIQTTIIYKMDLFREQYVDVFHRFSDCIIIEEVNFHNDFMDIIEQMDTRYVLFGTDDVVYYDTVDFAVIDETFRRFSDDIFGFSLRLSPTYLMDIENTITDVDDGGEKVFSLNWKKGAEP